MFFDVFQKICVFSGQSQLSKNLLINLNLLLTQIGKISIVALKQKSFHVIVGATYKDRHLSAGLYIFSSRLSHLYPALHVEIGRLNVEKV